MVMQVWACLDKTIPGVQPSPHGSAGPVLVVITIIGQLCLAACRCNSAVEQSHHEPFIVYSGKII